MTDPARIPLAGVIGSPISHSRSPALHGYWLQRYGIKGHYIPMDVAQVDLKEALATLPKLGFVGLNVTIPHKETVLALADIVTDRAALIGAANTLIFRKDGKVFADNTDGSGFIANLRQNAPHWAPATGPAVVWGRRGGARRHRRPDRGRRPRDPRRQPHPHAGRGACGPISGPRCMCSTGCRPATCWTTR
jgi:shikimate dehydrogenase